MHMRPSKVLSKLREGKVVSSFKFNLSCPRAVEIVAMLGYDCVWLCREHTASDLQLIERQINAAKMHDVDTLVRVPRGSYSDLVQPLELDASGIMVPHCMSAADARQIARTSRFHPLGRRPVDGGNADGSYCLVDFQQYLKEANEQRFVIIQIEDPEPLAELDAIAAVPGIDMIFFGPGDFSHAIGAPGKWDDPRLIDARRKVAAAAIKHGKFAGTVGMPNTEMLDMGYRFFNFAADVFAIAEHAKEKLGAFDQIIRDNRVKKLSPKTTKKSGKHLYA
ncbi:MAG: aldolase/citrate lyase family protein [Kiritimatiellia bacterium]